MKWYMKYDQLVASRIHVHHATLHLLAKRPMLLRKAAMVKARAGHSSEQRHKEPHDARLRKAKSGLFLSVSEPLKSKWLRGIPRWIHWSFLATLATGQTVTHKIGPFRYETIRSWRPSKPETGAASNASITCQWCLIATGLQRNLLKTCILSMHAEMITKRLWDSISWDFLVQFLRVSRFLSLQPSSHHRPTSQYRANAAHVNPSGRWDLIQSD